MALTQAQIRDHAGRLMLRGFAASLPAGEDVSVKIMVGWVKAHITDSAFSTASDRKEAAITILREIYERSTGMVSTDNRRHFRKWVDGMLEYGDGILIEPMGA